MKRPPTAQSDPSVLAIVHRLGRSWRCLIGSLKGAQPAISAVREFPIDRISRLDEWLDEHHAGAVLCVLPSAAVICRNCPLPDASPEQLQQALQLQAEAHLLGIAPPHRVGMAVLPQAPGETTRTGLVLAWPEAARFDAPPTNRPVTFIADVAALAALVNGMRSDEPVLWLDRNDGSIALAIAHPGGAVFRATREEAESTENWRRSINRIMAETALSVGHTGTFVDTLISHVTARTHAIADGDARLILPSDLLNSAAKRVQGSSGDPSWWSQYGIAVGALLARAGQLAPLTRMVDSPPVEDPTPVGRAMEKLSNPRIAARVILISVLVLMLAPLVFSFLRLQVLKVRHGDINQTLVAARQARQELAMYEELERQKVWPMTKLLADIAANTPIGIEYDMIRVEAGKDFAVSGTAIATGGRSPAQLVAQMQENLGRDGMFSDIALNAGKSDNLGRYKFDVSAKITRPFQIVQYDEDRDFINNSYRERLYGKSAIADATSRASASGSAASTSGATTNPSIEGGNPDRSSVTRSNTRASSNPRSVIVPPEGESGDVDIHDPSVPDMTSRFHDTQGVGREPGATGGGDDGFVINPGAVPPPVTAEQLAVMSKAELKDTLAKVAKARMNRDLDKDVQQRLRQEQDMILEYLRKATN